MIEWIMSNKEWIFSGLGIAVISALFAIIKTKIPKNSERNLNVSGDKIIIEMCIRDRSPGLRRRT